MIITSTLVASTSETTMEINHRCITHTIVMIDGSNSNSGTIMMDNNDMEILKSDRTPTIQTRPSVTTTLQRRKITTTATMVISLSLLADAMVVVVVILQATMALPP